MSFVARLRLSPSNKSPPARKKGRTANHSAGHLLCSTSVYYLFLVYLRCSTLAFSCSCASWNNSLIGGFLFVFCLAFSNKCNRSGWFSCNFLVGWGWRVGRQGTSSPGTPASDVLLCVLLASSLGFVLVILRPSGRGLQARCWQGGESDVECGENRYALSRH